MKNYRIGDDVTIRKDLLVGEFYGDESFVSQMLKYRGEKTKIVGTSEYGNHLLDIDKEDPWAWTEEMFE
jgi:hypothetical protein